MERAVSMGGVAEFQGRIVIRPSCAGTVRRKKARGMDSVEQSNIKMVVDQNGIQWSGPSWWRGKATLLALLAGKAIKNNDLVYLRKISPGLNRSRKQRGQTLHYSVFAPTRSIFLPLPSFTILSKNVPLPPLLPPQTSAPRDLQHPFLCIYLSYKKPTLVICFQTQRRSFLI